jgi:hypothetical protein
MISWKQVLLILFLAAVTGNLAGRGLKPVTTDCFPARVPRVASSRQAKLRASLSDLEDQVFVCRSIYE